MADLPFLKNKNKKMNTGGGSSPAIQRTPDQSSDEALMAHIGSELMDSISRKDIKSLRAALEALVHMIQEQDKENDAAE